jgi:PPP family 3-phenylpropionic acid transporter
MSGWRNADVRVFQDRVPSLYDSHLVLTRSPLPRFLLLYAALFASFGTTAPFLPELLQQDGLAAGAVGIVLAGGTAVRLLAGPLGGRLADRTGWPVGILAGCTAAAAIVALGYVPARGLPLLLLVSVTHASALAPLTPIADALTLGSAREKPGFAYGWVRAAGSAAFIVGTLAAGQSIGRFGLDSIIWLMASLLAVAAGLAWLVPNRVTGAKAALPSAARAGAFRTLLGIPVFRRLMIVAALIGGSHALHDGFEVIRWRSAGLSASQCSVLWAMSVAAEVCVFLVLGHRILAWMGPGRAMMLSAMAGIIRWGTAAQTAWFPAMALVEPLHGLTFALLHLACMEMIQRVVPANLAATAQTFYATIAMGAMSASVTLVAGLLYGAFGAASFWATAAMCACALPIARDIRLPALQPPGNEEMAEHPAEVATHADP